MVEQTWSAVDEYVSGLLAPHDEALEKALESSAAAGLPAIQVSPPQGKLLTLLAETLAARTILEFGTLGRLHDRPGRRAGHFAGPGADGLGLVP